MTTPCLLAIDTSTEALAVALCSPRGRWLADEPGGALASSRLLPLVRHGLAQAGLRMADLQAVAFGQGPGAFTGLRTACAVAQGLALGVGCPVLAIGSLELVAEQLAPPGVDEAWVAMDARMDEVYAAAYARLGPARWRCLKAPALYSLPALAALWQADPPRAVLGTAMAAHAPRLAVPADALVRAPGEGRAAALLRLAEAAWADGAPRLDAADALPLYLRDKVALTTAERTALREGR